jgi:hypothetical protein
MKRILHIPAMQILKGSIHPPFEHIIYAARNRRIDSGGAKHHPDRRVNGKWSLWP